MFNCAKKIVITLFLFICIASLFLFYSLIFREQKNISEEENRTLTKVPSFTFQSFMNRQYQDDMENAIADQLSFSTQIKLTVKSFYNDIGRLSSNFILDSKNKALSSNLNTQQKAQNFTCDNLQSFENLTLGDTQQSTILIGEQKQKNKYIYTEVANETIPLYSLDDSAYLVNMWLPPEAYNFAALYEPEMLALVTGKKYLYFINTSLNIDFNNINDDAFEYIKTQFDVNGFSELKFDTLEEFKNLFYQTDHHWNYKGSYKGYKEIMALLEGDDFVNGITENGKIIKDPQIRIPTGTHTYETIFNGGNARDSALKWSKEYFTVYNFDIPPYRTFINGIEKQYGSRELYSDEKYPNNLYSNHYGLYYGEDYAQVVYKFDNPTAENLLVLSTSWSNAINELIASHYNETHFLDFRYYRKQFGHFIDAESYMKEHNISKMIMIGDISSLGVKWKK